MGKDKTWDENAAASSNARDRGQKSRDAALARIITEAVAQQTKTITETFQRQMDKTHAQYEELLKALAHKTFQLPLRLLLAQKASE